MLASALFLSGCGSTGTWLLKSNDAESFNRIHPGQGYDEIIQGLEPFVENSFSVLEDGVHYQYLQTRHQKSGILIGFYFEDEKLSGLILGKDVYDFHRLRMSDTADDHWLNRGILFYKTWIGERDKLGNGSHRSARRVALRAPRLIFCFSSGQCTITRTNRFDGCRIIKRLTTNRCGTPPIRPSPDAARA